MQTVARIIDLFGGLDRLADEPIQLGVEGFMTLSIEYVGTGPRGFPLVSVSHYFLQKGDLMSDPDCTFEVDGETWLPVSYQQDNLGLYQEVVTLEGDQAVVDERLERELRQFAAAWDRNLRGQGFLAAAERQAATAAVTVTLRAASVQMPGRQLVFEVRQGGSRRLIQLYTDAQGEVHLQESDAGEVLVGGCRLPLVKILRGLAAHCGPDDVGRTWTVSEARPGPGNDESPRLFE
jgi:hypothetical protein